MPEMWWACLLVGLAAGLVSATFGVGSGIIMVPAGVLILSLGQKQAQGVALCVMVPMAMMGAWRYIQDPTIKVDLPVAALIAVAAVVGSFFGHKIATRLDPSVLRKAFAVFIVIVAVKMFFTKPRDKKASGPPSTGRAPATTQAEPQEGNSE